MNPNQFHSLLLQYVPSPAVAYCFELWQKHPFRFRLRKARVSKVGDFSCRPGKEPRITINEDSHSFLFLLTYIHEVSHLIVHENRGWKVRAHGQEWKQTFRELMIPVLLPEIFPADLLHALQLHLKNPRASSFSDRSLNKVLRQFDSRKESATLLSDVPEGARFGIRGRWFTKGKQKRTRVICRELNTRRNYLIPADAPVESNPAIS